MTITLGQVFIVGSDSRVGTLERTPLTDAAEYGWDLLFYHDPDHPLGRVREAKGRYFGEPS